MNTNIPGRIRRIWNNQRRKQTLLLALIAGVAWSARTMVIDDFNQGDMTLNATNYAGTSQVQTGLDPAFTVGGTRRVTVQSLKLATGQINAAEGDFNFEATSDFGYFALDYGAEAPLGLQAGGNGGEALVLTFSALHVPGLYRGSYDLTVNGITHDILEDLAALNGPGTIRIPFSAFSSSATFMINTIEFRGVRVEEGYHFALDSISTGSSNAAPRIATSLSGPNQLRFTWGTNWGTFALESAPAPDAANWEPVTNGVSMSEGRFSATIDMTAASRFFRLRQAGP
ncbi:MAG TPA: hypothetical protein VHH88_06285 [Verrucomicrobiae bacterium]|nr:hypothetical protein [Verrucomicrobiae bacterium]